jgi:drug/metabolite transporter superfamily protein YnfA
MGAITAATYLVATAGEIAGASFAAYGGVNVAASLGWPRAVART